MSTQPETVKIVKPFIDLLKDRGWTCKNVIGNQYMEGFPDFYIYHTQYTPRWVEFKVMKGNVVSLTPAQKRNFPIMISCNVPIYIIAAPDLRGRDNYQLRLRMYNKLFEEPNAHFALNTSTMRFLK